MRESIEVYAVIGVVFLAFIVLVLTLVKAWFGMSEELADKALSTLDNSTGETTLERIVRIETSREAMSKKRHRIIGQQFRSVRTCDDLEFFDLGVAG